MVIEKDLNRNSVLQMWHLHLQSVQACVGAWFMFSYITCVYRSKRPTMTPPLCLCVQMSPVQTTAPTAS